MKILIIHTGGTISCTYENGVLSPRADITPIIEKTFKNYRDVKLVHKRLCSVLSENTDSKILNKIVLGVRKYVLSGKYDGVIVTLGSDALAYTSAAISYAVGLSKTPCITVCSNLPLSVPYADGNANLKAAVAVIRSKKAVGALTVYPEEDGRVAVFRATRIMQQPPYLSAPVPVGEIYGTVKDGIFFKNEKYVEESDSFTFNKPSFSAISPVFLLNVYPGMLYPTLPRKTKAVILGAYHSGTVNTQSAETVKFAKRCKKRGIKVYVSGLGDGADYESMRLYEELSLIRLPKLSSPAAMYIKLWLLNSQSKKFTDENLFSPLGGDLAKASVKTASAPKTATQSSTADQKNGSGSIKDTAKPNDLNNNDTQKTPSQSNVSNNNDTQKKPVQSNVSNNNDTQKTSPSPENIGPSNAAAHSYDNDTETETHSADTEES